MPVLKYTEGIAYTPEAASYGPVPPTFLNVAPNRTRGGALDPPQDVQQIFLAVERVVV